jgi:hypothetical protein
MAPSMPRYFFNIVRGKTVIPDPEGDALRSDADARRHASVTAQEMLEERHRYPRGMERWAFEITDQTGRHVATVLFSDFSSPFEPSMSKSKSSRR